MQAAVDLLAERGPDGVSGREIADRAGVNYGLIHYYFGGKKGLFEAALDHLRNSYVERLDQATGQNEWALVPPDETLARVFAFAALSSSGLLNQTSTFPAMERVRKLVAESLDQPEDHFEVRTRAAFWAAARLGWTIFEDFVSDAMEIPEAEQSAARAHVLALLQDLATGSPRTNGSSPA